MLATIKMTSVIADLTEAVVALGSSIYWGLLAAGDHRSKAC